MKPSEVYQLPNIIKNGDKNKYELTESKHMRAASYNQILSTGVSGITSQ